MGMFESKNEKLYTANDTLQDVEPSTLTEFGQNVSDNLTVLGNRIGSIMSGSSDDSWDDKVKTQITSAIETIGKAANEEQNTAEVVSGAAGILTTLKTALEEYVLGYDSWEEHLNSKPREERETYEEDGVEKTRYTQSYLDKKAAWDKEDEILKKTVPELEEQAETWMEQLRTYFEAYNFETHEIDTTIYVENKDPLKFYGELYSKYEGEYVPLKENAVAAETETQPVEEVEDPGTTAERMNPEKVVEALGDVLVNGEITDEEAARDRLKEAGYTEEEINKIIDNKLWNKQEQGTEFGTEAGTEVETEVGTESGTEAGTESGTEADSDEKLEDSDEEELGNSPLSKGRGPVLSDEEIQAALEANGGVFNQDDSPTFPNFNPLTKKILGTNGEISPVIDSAVQTQVNDVVNGMIDEGMGDYILSGEGLELFWDRMTTRDVGADDISGAVADLMRKENCTDDEITSTLHSSQNRHERKSENH